MSIKTEIEITIIHNLERPFLGLVLLLSSSFPLLPPFVVMEKEAISIPPTFPLEKVFSRTFCCEMALFDPGEY
jgi:hypothetical protein